MDYSKWNHLEDSDDEAPAPKTASTSTGRAEELPPGVPPGAKQVDLNSLPPELANDATLMKDLADRGIIGEGMTKIQATPKGGNPLECYFFLESCTNNQMLFVVWNHFRLGEGKCYMYCLAPSNCASKLITVR